MAAATYGLALFKNGTELSFTRIYGTPITYGAPLASGIAEAIISGTTLVSVTQDEIDTNTGDLQLKNISFGIPLQSEDGFAVPPGARAILVYKKVGDIIIP